MADLLPDLPNATMPDGGIVDKFQDFSLDFAGGVQLGVVIAIGAIVFGTLFLFWGSRLFKITLFVSAFVFGAALGYFIVMQIEPTASQAALITGGILGLILGCLAVKVWKFSIFLLGAGCGVIIWLTFKALFPDVLDTEFKMYGVLAGLVILLGLIAIKMEKVWLILGTPLIGSFLLIQGVDHFVPEVHFNIFQLLNFQACPVDGASSALGVNGTSAMTPALNLTDPDKGVIDKAKDLVEDAKAGGGLGGTTCGCTFATCYILYAMVIVLTLLGIFIQYRYTSEYGRERLKKERHREEGRREGRRDRDRDRDRRRRSYSR